MVKVRQVTNTHILLLSSASASSDRTKRTQSSDRLHDAVRRSLDGRDVKKSIYVQDRLVNLVV